MQIWLAPAYTDRIRLEARSGAVVALAAGVQSPMFAVGTETGLLQLRQNADGTLLRNWAAHAAAVSEVAFIPPADQFLLSAGVEGTLRIWRASNGALVWTTSLESAGIQSLALSPDGARLALGIRDGSVLVANNPMVDSVKRSVLYVLAPSIVEGFRLALRGELDHVYRFEVSTDLRRWSPWTSVRGTADLVTIADPDLRSSQRFYRAIELPNP